MMRRVVVVVGALALLALLTGCEGAIEVHVQQRFPSNPPVADEGLRTRARAHSQQMCAARALSATPNPGTVYGEGAIELVDREPLGAGDPTAADQAATEAIWNRFDDDPRLDTAAWTRMAAGQATCDDGKLYMTLVLRPDPAPLFAGWASGVRRATSGNGSSSFAGITTNGATVAIQSTATNIGGGSSGPDTWLYSVGPRTLAAQGTGPVVPALAPGGSKLVFMRETIEAGSTVFPIESRNLATSATTRLVTNSSPGYPRSVSADGSVVAVQVFGAGDSTLQVLRNGTAEERGSLSGANFAISVSDDGTKLSRNGFDTSVLTLATNVDVPVASNCFNQSTQLPSAASSLSSDGRYLAYGCYDRPGLASDTDGAADLFLWDRTTGTSVMATFGTDGLGLLGEPSVSDDGRFVAFSYGTSPTSGGTYLWDRNGGWPVRIATVPSEVAVSGDGTMVAFTAVAPNRPSGSTIQDLFTWDNPAA